MPTNNHPFRHPMTRKRGLERIKEVEDTCPWMWDMKDRFVSKKKMAEIIGFRKKESAT